MYIGTTKDLPSYTPVLLGGATEAGGTYTLSSTAAGVNSPFTLNTGRWHYVELQQVTGEICIGVSATPNAVLATDPLDVAMIKPTKDLAEQVNVSETTAAWWAFSETPTTIGCLLDRANNTMFLLSYDLAYPAAYGTLVGGFTVNLPTDPRYFSITTTTTASFTLDWSGVAWTQKFALEVEPHKYHPTRSVDVETLSVGTQIGDVEQKYLVEIDPPPPNKLTGYLGLLDAQGIWIPQFASRYFGEPALYLTGDGVSDIPINDGVQKGAPTRSGTYTPNLRGTLVPVGSQAWTTGSAGAQISVPVNLDGVTGCSIGFWMSYGDTSAHYVGEYFRVTDSVGSYISWVGGTTANVINLVSYNAATGQTAQAASGNTSMHTSRKAATRSPAQLGWTYHSWHATHAQATAANLPSGAVTTWKLLGLAQDGYLLEDDFKNASNQNSLPTFVGQGTLTIGEAGKAMTVNFADLSLWLGNSVPSAHAGAAYEALHTIHLGSPYA